MGDGKKRSEWAEQEVGQAELGDERRTKHPRRGVFRAVEVAGAHTPY